MSRGFGETRRLLLVEDSPGDADLIVELLSEPAGAVYEVARVATLAAAAAVLRDRPVDAVLLDLGLPDGRGAACVVAIRASASDVPIVVLTGLDDDTMALSCIHAGAQDYLSKSDVQSAVLQRAIDYAIARVDEHTQRSRADALQQRLAAIVAASSDAIVSFDVDAVVTSWNRGAERTFGLPSEAAIGQPAASVLRAPPAATNAGNAPDAASTVQVPPLVGAREESRIRADGQVITVSTVGSELRDATGKLTGYAATYRDVTEARSRELELREKHALLLEHEEQMRALTKRLNAVREEERTRISREVHDELGQLLTGLKMDLRWIARRLEPGSALKTAISGKLEGAEVMVDATITAVQRIASELRPSTLDALGLTAAIRDESRRFQERFGVATTVNVVGNVQPDNSVATVLFRVFQELATNVARHARATRMTVEVRGDRQTWTVRVEDNGIGLPSKVDPRQSIGLLGVRDRLAAHGGELTLENAATSGTVATARIPRPGC